MNRFSVLSIEDDKAIRNLISITLESQDYRYYTVASGEEGLQLPAGASASIRSFPMRRSDTRAASSGILQISPCIRKTDSEKSIWHTEAILETVPPTTASAATAWSAETGD